MAMAGLFLPIYTYRLVQERCNSSVLAMEYIFRALTDPYNLSDTVNYIDIYHWYDLMKNIDYKWDF